MGRDIHQRQATATRRASLAVDRVITATSDSEKEAAKKWAEAWAAVARIRPVPLKSWRQERGQGNDLAPVKLTVVKTKPA